MAYVNQNFATLGVNLNRQAYGALDISSVFNSLGDLEYYLSKGSNISGVSDYWKNIVPYPYEGQVVATVIDGVVEVFVLALDEDDNFFAQVIGREADEKAISVDENGKFTLAGFGAAATLSLPQKQSDGTIKWVAISEIVQGDGNNLSYGDENSIVHEEQENGDLVLSLNGFAAAADNQIPYKDSEGNLSWKDEYSYDDTELRDKFGNYYTKDETNSKINEEIGKQIHLNIQVVESTSEMTETNIIYLLADVEAIGEDKYYEYIVVDGVPTIIGTSSPNLEGYIDEGELSARLANYYTKEAINTELNNYYTTTEVNDILGEYAKIAQIPTDYVTTTVFEEYKTAADNKFIDTTELADALADYTTPTDVVAIIDENQFLKGIDTAGILTYDEDSKTLGNRQIVDNDILGSLQHWVYEETVTEGGDTTSQWKLDREEEVSLDKVLQPATYVVTDEGITGTSGLITPEQVAKLSALVIGDEGVEISGKVNASNVEGLAAWVTTNRDSVEGLVSTTMAADINKIADIEANYIKSVELNAIAADNWGVTLIPENNHLDIQIPYVDNDLAVAGIVISNAVENGISYQEGKGSVHSLNVNKLTQTANEWLVLNGGNATLSWS